jgi:molybdate transport system substrate-binding protein
MKFRITRWFIALLLAALFSVPALADEVRVAVAANFTGAAKDIAARFEKHTGHRVKLSFGSTGKLFTQIENGAPFDVFLAADSRRPAKAEDEGLAVADTRFTYARGKLVLWSQKAGLFEDGEAYLKTERFPRAAIANPKTAPYGLAAEQVLEHLGLWDDVQGKLVRGDSIAQTFQFVATGNAEIGFVAYSQIMKWKDPNGSLWIIPANYYAPVEQQAVLLNRGANNPAAREFIEFLRGAAARSVIEGFGYGVE